MKRIIIILSIIIVGINKINAQDMKTKNTEVNVQVPEISIFPIGNENVGFKEYFTGRSWLAPLTADKELKVPMFNVTFEPGCRNNWHSHTGGQILIAVGGVGYYQERGEAARRLLPGDVVEITPDVIHWHGAAPDSWFSHIAIECNPTTNKNTWFERVSDEDYAAATSGENVSLENAARNYDKWFATVERDTLLETDPELAEMFVNFAFGETQQYGELDIRSRILATMASAIVLNARIEYRKMLHAAYVNGITPVEIREVLYHAVPYIGMAKVEELLPVMNAFFVSKGIRLPLDPQVVVTFENRFEKGLALQKSIFGEQIDKMYENSPENQLHIQKYLSANCFGDYQTRTALDIKTREMLTFSMLVSLGGCEPQVKGHIQGNVNVGNDKKTLLSVVTQLLPYIGYPRTLNAIACLNEMIPENK